MLRTGQRCNGMQLIELNKMVLVIDQKGAKVGCHFFKLFRSQQRHSTRRGYVMTKKCNKLIPHLGKKFMIIQNKV